MLVSLLYVSRANQPVKEPLIEAILKQSNEQNAEFGITGVLCSYDDDDRFLQVLEGGRDAVNRLYGNILRDGRHQDVTLLHYAEITTRTFAGWRMGRVDLSRVNRSTLLKYSELPRLDPYKLNGTAALALLEELMASAAVASFVS